MTSNVLLYIRVSSILDPLLFAPPSSGFDKNICTDPDTQHCQLHLRMKSLNPIANYNCT
jgi:hypothetical protein